MVSGDVQASGAHVRIHFICFYVVFLYLVGMFEAVHLQQLVKEKGMSVTILHEGPNKGKPPHNAYGALDAAGVTVHWCDDLSDHAAALSKLGGQSFRAVVDNWSKSPEQIKPYAELGKKWGVENFAYVSSAFWIARLAFAPVAIERRCHDALR